MAVDPSVAGAVRIAGAMIGGGLALGGARSAPPSVTVWPGARPLPVWRVNRRRRVG